MNQVRLAVFASGHGTNFQRLAECVASGQIDAKLVCLLTDQPQAFVVARAKRLNIPVVAVRLADFADKVAYEAAILEALQQYGVDVIALAGYMKIVGQTLLDAYQNRIVNLHPAYLPEFPGAHGIDDAFQAGVDQSGVTVHLIDAGIDTGPILKQVRVPRLASDSMEDFEQRIHEAEYALYPQVLADFVSKLQK
jgi:phosphoribosylglycinamide formyltransferase-1